jgi:hypothetical protein
VQEEGHIGDVLADGNGFNKGCDDGSGLVCGEREGTTVGECE